MVVTALATSVLAIIIGNLSFGSTKTYRAEFVDATGLVKGDDVRIAGVKVGSVKGISIVDRTRAMVTFDVAERHRADARRPTPTSATATSSASATSPSPTRSAAPAC